MNARDIRKTESYRRGLDFIEVNKARLGAIGTSAGQQQLAAAVGIITTVTTDQGVASLDMLGQKAREKALAQRIRTQLMAPIAIFARAKLRGTPAITPLTRSARKLDGTPFVQAARAMATTASAHLPQLTEAGFPETSLHELEAAATELEASRTARAGTRTSRVEATKSIAGATVLAGEGVALLDAVIRRQFNDDAAFLAAWKSAHRIHAKSGSTRGSSSTSNQVATLPSSSQTAA